MPINEQLPEGQHESGWLSQGLPFTRWRRHRLHCNTCGVTSQAHHDLTVVRLLANLHSAFPERAVYEMERDILAAMARKGVVS